MGGITPTCPNGSTDEANENDNSVGTMPASLSRPPIFDDESSKTSFLESKTYLIIAIIFGLFYFLDVFVGMFMI